MKIRFHKSFTKDYRRLDRKVKTAFQDRLTLFCDNPYHAKLNNHPLKGKWTECRSINVSGNVRAAYKEKSDDEIIFIAIGSHNQLYG